MAGLARGCHRKKAAERVAKAPLPFVPLDGATSVKERSSAGRHEDAHPPRRCSCFMCGHLRRVLSIFGICNPTQPSENERPPLARSIQGSLDHVYECSWATRTALGPGRIQGWFGTQELRVHCGLRSDFRHEMVEDHHLR